MKAVLMGSISAEETTGCCRIYAGRVAADDAPTIARMRGASLVMIGKTNQHELALGGSNLFSACGRTGNPWDPARMTGGSSGGSAAAVAAGVVPWALGSDTGGSIRIPSSLCGTFGLKPTTGRLPTGGMLPLAPSLDTPGPVAATGEDLRLLYRILAGGPLEDAGAGAGARGGAGAGAGASPRLRLGVVGGYFAENVHPEVAAGVEAVAAALDGTGAVVEPVDGSGLDGSRAVWARVCYPEFVLAHPLLRDRLDEVLDPAIVEAVNLATRLTPAERAAAVERGGHERVVPRPCGIGAIAGGRIGLGSA
jgi:aspartyl-tRNA(Asn)/glutamyl-tRNA(Gln) amidotransferase subunit A